MEKPVLVNFRGINLFKVLETIFDTLSKEDQEDITEFKKECGTLEYNVAFFHVVGNSIIQASNDEETMIGVSKENLNKALYEAGAFEGEKVLLFIEPIEITEG